MQKLLTTLILTISAAIFFSCTSEQLTPQREKAAIIKGRLLGTNGKPMEMAHVHASFYGSKNKSLSVQANSRGEFEIPFINTDYIKLEFTGTNHKMKSLELFVQENKDIELTINLEAYYLNEYHSELFVIGSFNNFSFSNGSIKMKEEIDGSFSAIIPNAEDTLYYQILAEDYGSRSVNGSMSLDYVYDGGGDYRSILVSNDTTISIVYNPPKDIPKNNESKISSTTYNIQKYLETQRIIEELSTKASDIYQKTFKIEKYYKYMFDNLGKLIINERNEISRLLLSKYYIEFAFRAGKEINQSIINDFLTNISPLSAFWEKEPFLIISAINLLGENFDESVYLNQIINKNPLVNVKKKVLYELIDFAFNSAMSEIGEKYYKILLKNYPNSAQAKRAEKKYSPNKKIVVGKVLPQFSINNIYKSGEIITNERLKGKLVLIDIWATWCGPCVGEMENLHNAYKKFKNRNFEIFSISLDRQKEDIDKFRADKWKMPWLHAFSEGVWKSKFVKLFEVTGIPKGILISPEGKILEIGPSLRGNILEKTISKHLNKGVS